MPSEFKSGIITPEQKKARFEELQQKMKALEEQAQRFRDGGEGIPRFFSDNYAATLMEITKLGIELGLGSVTTDLINHEFKD